MVISIIIGPQVLVFRQSRWKVKRSLDEILYSIETSREKRETGIRASLGRMPKKDVSRDMGEHFVLGKTKKMGKSGVFHIFLSLF